QSFAEARQRGEPREPLPFLERRDAIAVARPGGEQLPPPALAVARGQGDQRRRLLRGERLDPEGLEQRRRQLRRSEAVRHPEGAAEEAAAVLAVCDALPDRQQRRRELTGLGRPTGQDPLLEFLERPGGRGFGPHGK